jgi:beta-glucanase (GH16 family)
MAPHHVLMSMEALMIPIPKPSPQRWRPALAVGVVAVLVAGGIAAANSAQAAVPAPTGWTQVFADDFTGTSLNTGNWRVSEGTSYPGGPEGFGTGEVEVSSRNNVTVANGTMSITAKGQGLGPWTAARIETNRQDFQPPAGGKLRIEASLRLPEAADGRSNGYWPAFWALGGPYRGNWWNWPMVGEIDIMENVSGLNRVWATMHCGTSPGGPCKEKDGVGNGGPAGCTPACTKSFHRYTIDWSRADQSVTWYVDGKQTHRVQRGVQVPADVWDTGFSHGFFIILNIAMGGEMPANMGVPLNASTTGGGHLDAEYVGVWSGPANAPPPTSGTTPPPVNTGTPAKALGKCLQLRGGSNADGTAVETWDCNGGENQKWTRVGDTVRSYGKCLDIANSGTANGSQVVLWPCHGGQGQTFQYRADGSLYNPRSQKCLEIPNSTLTNGTRVVIWTCDARPKQNWTFG